MRQIKFRAWFQPKGIMIPNITLAGLKNWEDVNFYEWMQFTGLLDKNGKEIYERDIIEYDNDRFVVFFEGGAFYRNYGALMSEDNDESTIIGNIYENPNLLSLEEK